MKSAEEIMKILDAYDLTGSLRDAGELADCSHHTVKGYVDRRAAGGLSETPAARPQLIDEYLPKVEEWVERSKGRVRADVAHEKLLALGYTGSERTTRRAVAGVKATYKAGRVRVHRPWITEPGMWLQYDYGDGPVIDGAKTVLFVAWLAWSRFRVVIPLRDKTLPSVFAALDVTFRRLGGVPTYVLTDNEKSVTTEHVAGMPVRNRQLLGFAEHYSVVVHTCVPADPASKGGLAAWADEETIVISSAAGRLAISSDVGQTWTLHPRSIGVAEALWAGRTSDGQVEIIASVEGQVISTKDAGTTTQTLVQ